MKIPRLLQAILVLVGVYGGFVLVFDVILEQVIPSSLLNMYMFFVVAGTYMVFTFNEESTEEIVGPIKALVRSGVRPLGPSVVVPKYTSAPAGSLSTNKGATLPTIVLPFSSTTP